MDKEQDQQSEKHLMKFLELCKKGLDEVELGAVEQHKHLLTNLDLLSPDIVRACDIKQLEGYGFSPGAARALLKAVGGLPVGGPGGADCKKVKQLLTDHPPSQEPSQPPPRDDPSDCDNKPGTDSGRSSSGGVDGRSGKRRKGDGGASLSNTCINPRDGSGSRLQRRMRDNRDVQLSRAPNKLQMRDLICKGSSGLVMHGSFNGHPAVIKMYGPDSAEVAVCRHEASVYDALLPLQGTVVPRLLGWGQLPVGVYYLATALVDGTPLSSLSSSQQPVAAAAAAVQSALQQICSVQPGFLHGSLRLANILLLHGTQDAATPTAMFLDFATSRLNGSRSEVRMQRRQLKFLLSRTS